MAEHPRCVAGKWFCSVCFMSCSTKANLLRHKRFKHTRPAAEATDEPRPAKAPSRPSDNQIVLLESEEEISEWEQLQPETPASPRGSTSSGQAHTYPGIFDDIEYLTERLCHLRDRPPECNDANDSSSSCGGFSFKSEELSDSSITWSEDEDHTEESEDEEEANRKPIFEGAEVTYEEHLVAVMSYAIMHDPNLSQITDLPLLITSHCPEKNQCVASARALFKEICRDIAYKFHDVCEQCHALFPGDVESFQSSTAGCAGYVTVVHM